MLRVGRLFNQVADASETILRSRGIAYRLLMWVVAPALAIGVPVFVSAQQSNESNITHKVPAVEIKAESVSDSVADKEPKPRASTRVDVNSSHSNSGTTSNKPRVSAEVRVNGRQIKLPDSGSVHTSVPNGSGGSSSVDITINSSNGSAANQNSSTSNLNIFSHSSSQIVSEEGQ